MAERQLYVAVLVHILKKDMSNNAWSPSLNTSTRDVLIQGCPAILKYEDILPKVGLSRKRKQVCESFRRFFINGVISRRLHLFQSLTKNPSSWPSAWWNAMALRRLLPDLFDEGLVSTKSSTAAHDIFLLKVLVERFIQKTDGHSQWTLTESLQWCCKL